MSAALSGPDPLSGRQILDPSRPAELVLLGGLVLTLDPRQPRAEAVAIQGGRILAVGTEQAVSHAMGPQTRRINLHGATVIPAFHDCHVHLWKEGMLLQQVNARPAAAPTLEALIAAFGQRARQLPAGTWIEGRGYNEVELPEGRHPTRWDLDRASTQHPIVLGRTCGHILVGNSLALEKAGIHAQTSDPPGGQVDRAPDGTPTGVLRETAMTLLRAAQPPPSTESLQRALIDAGRRCLAMGITRIGEPGIDQRLIDVYTTLDEEGRLPLHCDLMALTVEPDGRRVAPPARRTGRRLSLETCKLFADGGLSSGTAALSMPYRGKDGHGAHDCGIPRFPQERLDEEIRTVAQAGLTVAVHAIGDKAIDAVLDSFEALSPPAGPFRLRIEHFGLPNAGQIARAQRLQVQIATQPTFLYELGETFRHHLPDILLDQCYPFRSMLQAGVGVGFSSDGPVVSDIHPLRGLHAAYFRQSKAGAVIAAQESLSVLEALHAYTVGSAWVVGLGHELGKIQEGFRAELAVLSGDPSAVAPECLPELQVLMTLSEGQCVFEA